MMENSVLSVVPVKKLSMRAWSFMRCIISPVVLLSKKLTGSFISLMRKSVSMEILIRVLICSNIQLRIKPTLVLPINSITCAMSIK